MVSEVREFLMDRCSEDNRLLLSKQFTNSQIINAMATAVDEWNDSSVSGLLQPGDVPLASSIDDWNGRPAPAEPIL